MYVSGLCVNIKSLLHLYNFAPDDSERIIIRAQMLPLTKTSQSDQGHPASYGKLFKDVRAKFSNIDFFLQILPLKDDELVMSEM